jgi:lipopolysaccharide/colanic/teichoic acid biosynthesis glycosyltransferase
MSIGGSEIETVFVDQTSLDVEIFWPEIDKAFKEGKEVWVSTCLLKSLRDVLGETYEGRKWLKVRSDSCADEWPFRIRDLLLSFLAMVILSPLMLAVALLIKLTSWGPVFYKTVVIGKNGKQFSWRKFRSMRVVDEKEDAGTRREMFRAYTENRKTVTSAEAPMKTIDRNRVTSVGRIIRKYSIDELPQLWNVIRGDMSLVGPRPCLPYEAESYTGWRSKRFNVRPGLTGLWQVFGRSRVPFEEAAAMDVYYLYRRSFLFDLYLILKTFGVVLVGKGAQ